MRNTEKRKGLRLKGFTLTEMIVVIAIIAILAAVLAPTMSAYYRNSRIKDANSIAKMVYNSAQSEVQRYLNIDRINDPDVSMFDSTVMIAYDHDTGDITYSKVATNAFITPTDADELAQCEAIVNGILRTVSGSEASNWAVYIDHYIVRASISAKTNNTNYVGFYSSNKACATDPAAAPYAMLFPDAGGGTNRLAEIAAAY